MALETQNMPSESFKNDFDEVDEAIFLFVERPCELIFCILCIEKKSWNKSLKGCIT
jgi:hypothetical protein